MTDTPGDIRSDEANSENIRVSRSFNPIGADVHTDSIAWKSWDVIDFLEGIEC